MSEKEIIRDLESRDDEYSKCRAHHAKKRSTRFKRIKVKVCVDRDKYGKYILPDYPFDPMNVKIMGQRYEIDTFIIHGREVIWTGATQSRPPLKIWATYEKLYEI